MVAGLGVPIFRVFTVSDYEPKLQCIPPDQTIYTFAQSGLGIVCICQKEVLSHLNICSL